MGQTQTLVFSGFGGGSCNLTRAKGRERTKHLFSRKKHPYQIVPSQISHHPTHHLIAQTALSYVRRWVYRRSPPPSQAQQEKLRGDDDRRSDSRGRSPPRRPGDPGEVTDGPRWSDSRRMRSDGKDEVQLEAQMSLHIQTHVSFSVLRVSVVRDLYPFSCENEEGHSR